MVKTVRFCAVVFLKCTLLSKNVTHFASALRFKRIKHKIHSLGNDLKFKNRSKCQQIKLQESILLR